MTRLTIRYTLLISVVLMLPGCGEDYSPLQGTAIYDENAGSGDGPDAKAIVVGDAHSPKLADFLSNRNIEVLDVPYTRYEASDIDIDGDYIVWSDNRNGALDIYGYQISTGTEFPISTAGDHQRYPKVSGDYVVWEDHRNGNADVYGYRISTKSEFVISNADKNQLAPEIDGEYVVWYDLRDDTSDIYAYHIPTGTSDIEVMVDSGDVDLNNNLIVRDQWYPKISGDYIVWQQYENGFSDIYGYRISDQTSFAITSESASSQFSPEIDGNYVVWVDNRSDNVNNPNGVDNIWGYDLSNGSSFAITTGSTLQWNPKLSGEYVTWQAYDGADFDIHAYNLATKQPIAPQVTSDPADTWDQILPAISGDYIVWQDNRSGDFDVWAYQISTGTSTRLLDNQMSQTAVVVDNGHIAWLDMQRGIVDVSVTSDVGGSKVFATKTWKTPAGVVDDIEDYDVLILANDFVSDAVVLELFDSAVSAGKGILGLGGSGTSLGQVLEDAGRYGINVTPGSGCWPMEVIFSMQASHPLAFDVRLVPPSYMETSSAVTQDELAISINTADDMPKTIKEWGYFSNYMCNPSALSLVEFYVENSDARVILDGTATMADGYEYWEEDRWNLLNNEVIYLKPVTK